MKSIGFTETDSAYTESVDAESLGSHTTDSTEKGQESQLLPLLIRLALLQHQSVDRLALQEAVKAAESKDTPEEQLAIIADHLHIKAAKWHDSPDPVALPLLVYDPDSSWRLLTTLNSKGEWVSETWDTELNQWREETIELEPKHLFAGISLAPSYKTSDSPVGRLIFDQLVSQKWVLAEAFIGGAMIATVSLVVSLYSMQVYDRVIPTGGIQTLLVLTLGIFLALGFEFLAKRLRARLYDRLIDEVDSKLARTVYLRFLSIRLDQLPRSVGSLASQLRGYETVRSFMVQITTQFLVDAPFSLCFLAVIAALAGPIALIPLVFLIISVTAGLWHKKQILDLMRKNHAIANMKTGLLVETVEGAEIIKSGQGGWRMLARWLNSSDEGRTLELASRCITERAQHIAASLQQVSYIGVVAMGALQVTDGELSFGGLIACSILSGRVLGPIAQVSNQLVQWGHAKAALQGLDSIWQLQGDDYGVDVPILPNALKGNFRTEKARFSVQDKVLLDLPNLAIRGGEKIAILGPIGSGKTTCLRLLSGMYKPQQGRIFLDDIDISQISKPWLAEHIGYLPQDGRLFAGTLRENLVLGLNNIGDGVLIDVARKTGLMNLAIASHPKGLSQPIFEGGIGLSGGQRQLVNLTRVFLRQPRIWLLDEPTASLDRAVEISIIEALKEKLTSESTLVLVTHKPEMLELVDRIIVITSGRIVIDGPRDAVLEKLKTPLKVRS